MDKPNISISHLEVENSELPYRKTWAEIDLDAIGHNLTQFRSFLPSSMEIMAVVKADGYGHGAIEVAEEALLSGATWLGVTLLEEALELRKAGIEAPILVLGYLTPELIPVAQVYHISITLTDAESFKEMVAAVDPLLPALAFHLKVDTGMSRIGILEEDELEYICAQYKQVQGLVHWEGIYTHLATADEEDETYLQQQTNKYTHFLALLKQGGIKVRYRHIANSAGAFKHKQFLFSNMVRLGISMYGLYPDKRLREVLPFELQEAFSLHTQLILVKQVPAGTRVSYGGIYVAEQEQWIGTLPIGYADGYSRKLSNQAQVIVDGKKMKIAGRICMDQTMVALDQHYPRNEKVTLIGKQKEAAITVDEVARWLETINYEIPCMIGKRVPRIYKGKRLPDAVDHVRIISRKSVSLRK